ncbi:MAG TPA: sugar kinase [Candidatus Competibacteraceae bacterium]|nr:sugar kinase [Candidatus Competibacteraceae bacterium]
MTKTIDVLGLGEPLVEFAAVRGEPGLYRRGFGGDTSNTVIAAARQGARAAYFSAVGADEAGQALLALWHAEGVNTAAVAIDPARPTGVYFVGYDADGRHHFSYLRAGSAAAALGPLDLARAPLAASRFLHLSAISQAISTSACDLCFAAIEAARGAGTAVSYDANLRLKLWSLPRARAVIRESAAQADYFLPSLEELRTLIGATDPQSCLDWCLASGARNVVLKMGADGAWVCAAGAEPVWMPGRRVVAVDATGAGDCFDGALLARLAAGDDLVAAVRYAHAAAALSVTGQGAVAPIPRAAAVRALLAAE